LTQNSTGAGPDLGLGAGTAAAGFADAVGLGTGGAVSAKGRHNIANTKSDKDLKDIPIASYGVKSSGIY
jgi:hypothetical protein